MKKIFYAALCGVLFTLVGCDQGTSGGPGATTPTSETSIVGQDDNTFSLDVPSHDIMQGESNTLTIEIERGTNFDEEVKLMLGDLPTGLVIEPANAMIKHGDMETKLIVKAAANAALGDFTVKVMGHPTNGAVAESELKISISEREPAAAANTLGDNAKENWDAYIVSMQVQLDQYNAKIDEWQRNAAIAEGQARTDLEAKLALARAKRDTASDRLNELRLASADRWEKVKLGVGNAFDDLQTIFK